MPAHSVVLSRMHAWWHAYHAFGIAVCPYDCMHANATVCNPTCRMAPELFPTVPSAAASGMLRKEVEDRVTEKARLAWCLFAFLH